MAFTRFLSDNLIESLNQLAADPASWWYKLANDVGLFFAVRNGYCNIYVNGGSLLRIDDGPDGPRLSTHEEYLVLPSDGNRYATLGHGGRATADLISSPEQLVEQLPLVKTRIRRCAGNERIGVCRTAARVPEVIDIEITDQDAGSDVGKKVRGSIDLAAVDPCGVLWFFEAKLLKNSELHSTTSPKVIDQIAGYRDWLTVAEAELITAYNAVRDCHLRLKGRLFEQRRYPEIRSIRLPPRLLVFGFDDAQKRHRLPAVVDQLESSGLAREDIVAVGDGAGFKARHLFG